MKLKHSYTGFILALYTILVSSCEQNKTAKLPPPEIAVTPVIQKDVPLYREFVGQAYGLVDIPIRARVEGYLEGIHFEEGRRVKKGQLLYTIDSQPFQAEVAGRESEVAEAQTYLVNATNELERYKPLAEINAVSKSDLDAAQASRDAAEASLDAAKANLKIAKINLSYCSIRSPINGLIGKTEARTGEFVGREPNPVILNVVSKISEIRVQFFLTEAEYLIIMREINKQKDTSEVAQRENENNLELILSDGSVYNHKGHIDFIDRNVDSKTGSILLQGTFPNPENLLRPGMFTKVRVEFDVAKNAILVPQRCVTELQGQFSVYILTEGNIIKSQQIKATQKIGDLWLIEEGLKSDDKVVIDGLQKIASGMVIKPIEEEFKSQTAE